MSIYGKFLSSSDEKTSISNNKAKKSVLLKESKKKQKLNESILEDKLEKVYDVLDGFNIKYYDNVETSHHEQDGEEWYDYLGVFEFDEEIEEKMMNRLIKEIEKSLKYSEVYPTDGDEGYQGFTITLGEGDEDDLFESKKSKMNEEKYDVESVKNKIDKELKKFGYKIANYQKELTKYGTFRFELDKIPSEEDCEKIKDALTKFGKNKERIEVGCNTFTERGFVQVEHFDPDKKVNENLHDIEHLVLFPEDLTDDEEYSRMVLLGNIGNISELTDSMGDIYITSMKEVPENKNEPYNSKTRVTITFEGDDVNQENLEKIIEFINSETVFKYPEIESDNEISFDFDPYYV